MDNRQRDVIEEHVVVGIILFLVMFSIETYLIFAGGSPDLMDRIYRYAGIPVILIGGTYMSWIECRKIYVNDTCLEFRLFGLRYRTIPWHRVMQICLTRSEALCASPHSLYIMLVLRGGPKFYPGHNDPDWFVFKHPRHVVRVAPRRKNLMILEKYYGKIDIIWPEELKRYKLK